MMKSDGKFGNIFFKLTVHALYTTSLNLRPIKINVYWINIKTTLNSLPVNSLFIFSPFYS